MARRRRTTRTRVLGFVSRPDYRPMTVKALSRAFGIDPATSTPTSAGRSSAWSRRGKLVVAQGQDDREGRRGREEGRRQGAIIGTFRRTSKGFGFVRPTGADRPGRSHLHPRPSTPPTPPPATRSP